MYDDIDLEDIECRLYSQVYHSSAENEEIRAPSEPNIILCANTANGSIHNNRYFSKAQASDLPSFIPLERENNTNSSEINSIHNSISFNTNSTDITTEGNSNNQFQNNITVNQYTLPLLINSNLSEVLNPSGGEFFVPWCVKNKKLLDKKNRKRQRRLENRRQKNKDKRNPNYSDVHIELNRGALRKVNHVVFVSDESDNECVIVSEMCKETQKQKKLNSGTCTLDNVESDSDEIIYIPPPPIEVINVDVEDEATENVCAISKKDELTIITNNTSNADETIPSLKTYFQAVDQHEASNIVESPTANDFLDNSGVVNSTNKFNFSLHGSVFNNAGEFIRPANPVEYCETESSCSTNDFNRDNNSVKTIVFNEVDFPREDIFSDKNLEGFGTYITPKRKIRCESKGVLLPKTLKLVSTNVNEKDSSSSSSETDYERSDILIKNSKVVELAESNKRLPILSPMLCEKEIENVKNKVAAKCYNSNIHLATGPVNTKKHSGRRKSNMLDNLSSDSSDEELLKPIEKKMTKKKKKASHKKRSLLENLSKTKSNKECPNKDIEKNDSGKSENETVVGNTITETRINEANEIENSDGEDALHISNENTENVNKNILNTSRKKKKKHVLNSKNHEIDNASNSSSGENINEKVRKKKRRSFSVETSTNIGIGELHQSWVGISDINIDNRHEESPNGKGNSISTDKKVGGVKEIPREVPVESQNNKSCSVGLINTSTEDANEALSVPVSIPLNTQEENQSDEEIIVVDETVSDGPDSIVKENIEIVVSSDSEYDFKELRDVGKDLKLANCSVNVGSASVTNNDDIIDVDDTSNNFTSYYVMSKNLCEDYNKFDVEQIQSSQSDDPEFWKILPRDQYLFLNNESRGPRCNRCRHFGHIAIRCTEKPDPPKCSLCGFSDHQEPRCPNKRCTQCGNEGDYSTIYCWKCVKFRNSICRECNMRGHIANSCPDLWRRYHLTTEIGPIVVSQEPQLKPRNQLWCSGCAGQGHLEHECDYYNREYPPTNPCIVSYKDILNLQSRSRTLEERVTTPSPPPPPDWNANEQNISYQNVPSTSLHSLPSTSRDTAVLIPPLMSQIIDTTTFPPSMMLRQNHMTVPNKRNSNHAPASTTVLNPFSVLIKQGKNIDLDQMMTNYVNDGNDINYIGCYDNDTGKTLIHPHMLKSGTDQVLKNDQWRVKQIIMSMPSHAVKRFFRKELDDLETVVSQSDPKYLKKKLFKYDRISLSKRTLNCEVVKERCFWFRIFNMFIFGVHQFKDGKIHVDFMKRYLSEPKQNKLDNHKRKTLLSAYNYIFDANRHNINYYKILQQIINRCNTEN